MSQGVQITLIICGTIIVCNLIVLFTFKNIWNKEKKTSKSFGYQGTRIPGTSSSYALMNIKPPSTGSKIGHNPPPKGEKPGFPGSRLP